MARIGIGIGGWTYAPWRGLFYPEGLAQARELSFASEKLTSIEINGTYYRLQSAESFERWSAQTPENFVFSVKAHRFAVSRSRLAESGEAVARFLESGLTRLGSKLGPILWQLPPTKRFDADDLSAFLDLLPKSSAGVRLRHVLDVRHPSFEDPAFIDMLRERNVALCCVDGSDHPGWADATADFVYLRLRNAAASCATGYGPAALSLWAERIRTWAAGDEPQDLPRIAEKSARCAPGRDVFAYAINGAKERAPAAAMALIEALKYDAEKLQDFSDKLCGKIKTYSEIAQST